MAQSTEADTFTSIAEADMGIYLRVTAGTAARSCALAGDAVAGIGVLQSPAYDTKPVAVKAAGKGSSGIYIASEAISIGEEVNAAASGKVQGDGGTVVIGTAAHATTADGDQIEVIHHVGTA